MPLVTTPRRTREEMNAEYAAFAKVKNFKMPFGRFRGTTLDRIASSDDGLLYIEWVSNLEDLHEKTRDAVMAFLCNPQVSKALVAAKTAKAVKTQGTLV